ncbi:serine/threonine-protein kinase [Gandjariella thermophila]|uniref:non-specific serine/threonine protein kinase n=1 Tax=Gandjariella thermophila TaxID=1931992 RepID=A0A4D4IYX1_9PSEU|nr:serine/threonine protein kinase [Gandjariella thermophila]
MGVVWQAQDERLERMVAIKQLLLQPGLGADETEDARRRAMREARIAARLQHPNAIAVFDVAEHDGDPCLVMEYLESRSLSRLLHERGALPVQEAAAIGRQVASALAAAHAAGIVHRDIKPANILVNDSGIAKITDFGISRAVGDSTVTKSGMLAGTPAYLAPEVARGQDPSPASDVFSLGATLYHVVEGRMPFGDSQNALALLYRVAAGEFEPPRQAGPMTALLMRLMRMEPGERPDMKEASEALRAIAAGAPLPPMRTPPAGAPRTPVVPAPAQRRPDPTRLNTQPVEDRPGTLVAAPAAQQAPPRRPPREPRLGGASDGRGPRRAIIAAVAIVVMAGLGILAANLINGNGHKGPGSPSASQHTSAPAQPPATSAPATNQGELTPPSPGGPIDYTTAGIFVINYYSSADTQAKWQMLTPHAQAAFGSQQQFQAYWGQYKQTYAQHAQGVTTNPDGSLQVPLDVTYISTSGSSQTTHREVRVTRVGGQLMIDSDAH